MSETVNYTSETMNYKNLGLVNTREMFKRAMAERYAVPAYNFNNMEQLQAIVTGSAVCKINIDSDGRLAMTAVIRKVFSEKPGEFDPRKYLGPARDELIQMVKDKNERVLGSANRI